MGSFLRGNQRRSNSHAATNQRWRLHPRRQFVLRAFGEQDEFELRRKRFLDRKTRRQRDSTMGPCVWWNEQRCPARGSPDERRRIHSRRQFCFRYFRRENQREPGRIRLLARE